MICDPSLWKIIGADLFRPVACTDLAPPQVRLFVVPALHLQVIELGPQECPGLCFVLELGFFRLAVDHDARRIVGQAHSRVRRIDTLSAVSRCAHDINTYILVRNIDFDILIDLRDHGHRTG